VEDDRTEGWRKVVEWFVSDSSYFVAYRKYVGWMKWMEEMKKKWDSMMKRMNDNLKEEDVNWLM